MIAVGHNGGVTSTFPAARKRKPGYDAAEVDAFFATARGAYGAVPGDVTTLTSDEIRCTAFRLRRSNGYSVRHVDAALERLEEAFAAREREQEISRVGAERYFGETRAIAQELVDRFDRPPGRRFHRRGPLTRGYHPVDVDALSDRLAGYFQSGDAISVENVRTVAFRARYGGYDESQVDHVLDAVVRVMLAVR